MTNREIISIAEQNLLLTLTLAICLCLYFDWGNRSIERHNAEVAEIQQEKADGVYASNNGKVNYSVCVFKRFPFWHLLYGLQFLTFPIAFLLLYFRNFLNLILSIEASFLSLLGYFLWFLDSDYYRKHIDDVPEHLRNLMNLVFMESSPLDFLTAILVSILFILQLTFLYRYVAELLPKRILFK